MSAVLSAPSAPRTARGEAARSFEGQYNPEIDGLRAIAVAAVIAFHLEPGGIIGGGFLGVDIFFVISGFLILKIRALINANCL